MSQTKEAINKIRSASKILTRSLTSNNSEGSSAELKMSKSPNFSLSQIMVQSSVENEAVNEILNEDVASNAVVPQEVCVGDCVHNRSNTGKMINCILCLESFHQDCVSANIKTKSTFTCAFCQNIPKMVRQIVTDIKDLKSAKESNPQLIAQIDALTIENVKLKSANTELAEKIDQLTAEKLSLEQENDSLKHNLKSTRQPSQAPSGSSEKTLIVGSSLLRNVTSRDVTRTAVMCKSGAKQKDAIELLRNEAVGCKQMYLLIGGNDCDDASRSTSSIMKERRELLEEAKKHADRVTVSSLIPCRDQDTQMKINDINNQTKKICAADMKLTYICNDTQFKLSDLSQNEALFVRDGVHLTYRGTSQLLQNLELTNMVEVKPRPAFRPPSVPFGRPQPPPGYPPMWMNAPVHGRPYQHPSPPGPPNCSWCRSPSHLASDCPRRGNRTCFRCGSPTHSARWCTL